jgi:hypothetical protein
MLKTSGNCPLLSRAEDGQMLRIIYAIVSFDASNIVTRDSKKNAEIDLALCLVRCNLDVEALPLG